MHINFPYQIGRNGRTATAEDSEYIKDLIWQVLFTIPGERVNRPSFGSGLNQLVFEPNSEELISTVQFLVRASLQEWLSELIEVNDVQIQLLENTMNILITYREIDSPFSQEAIFERAF
jgi:phage baseplate assembly protein W